MLQIFRNFFKSKIGIVVTLAFLALIALAFASMDVANTGTFGGVTGGDRVAVVGDRRITTSDLAMSVSSEVDQQRQQNPTITTEAFVEAGGVDNVLQQMISRWAIAEYANSIGLRAGSRLVDSEIVSVPAFRGIDGNFSEQAFRDLLRQRGLSESAVREDLAMGLLARQLVMPASYGAQMPASVAQRYAQLLGETRSGRIAALPAAAFAPEGDPTDAQLQAYYDENRAAYRRPERRVLRYATFGADTLGELPAPTEQQIAQRYQRDAETYAAIERRTLTQLVVPTQATARAIVEQVRGGATLETAAQTNGLATTRVPEIDRETLASRTSAAVAQAAFAAERGGVSSPAQGQLGWYVFRVDSVGQQAGRTLAQVRDEIARQLASEQRRRRLNEITAQIEDDFADGRSLSEVAGQYDLELVTTGPITATGQVYGTQERAPEELARVISLAFEMDEGDPQLAETEAGTTFLVFDVSDIIATSTAPLAEIRDDVTLAWRRDRAMAAASEAANRILARIREGASLAEALAEEEVTLPPAQSLSLNRQQLAQQNQVSPVTMLFFSMAEGTAKRLEQGNSWFVVELEDISAPDVPLDSPVIAATRQQLASTAGEEYIEQFVRAIQGSLDIETNQAAVDAVVAQLTGQAR